MKIQKFSQSKNKLGYVYLLTPQGVAHKVFLTERFLRRKMAEHEAIKAEIDALTAKEGALFADETSPPPQPQKA